MSRHYVNIEIDLDDIDDDVIQQEADQRGFGVGSNAKQDITEMFYAFHLGKTDRALELARNVAQDVTGRTLA